MKKEKDFFLKRSVFVVVILITVLAFFLIYYLIYGYSNNRNNFSDKCRGYGGEWLGNYRECEGISEKNCDLFGGRYSGCESACRHEENQDFCIALCVEVCFLD